MLQQNGFLSVPGWLDSWHLPIWPPLSPDGLPTSLHTQSLPTLELGYSPGLSLCPPVGSFIYSQGLSCLLYLITPKSPGWNSHPSFRLKYPQHLYISHTLQTQLHAYYSSYIPQLNSLHQNDCDSLSFTPDTRESF